MPNSNTHVPLFRSSIIHSRSKTNSKLKQITLRRCGGVDCTAVEEVSEVICRSQPFILGCTCGRMTAVVNVTNSATVASDTKPGSELYPCSCFFLKVLSL